MAMDLEMLEELIRTKPAFQSALNLCVTGETEIAAAALLTRGGQLIITGQPTSDQTRKIVGFDHEELGLRSRPELATFPQSTMERGNYSELGVAESKRIILANDAARHMLAISRVDENYKIFLAAFVHDLISLPDRRLNEPLFRRTFSKSALALQKAMADLDVGDLDEAPVGIETRSTDRKSGPSRPTR